MLRNMHGKVGLVGDHSILESEMKDARSACLCLRVLGTFEVVLDGTAIPEEAWPRRKTRDLLKVLLTAPGDVFTVDQLIDALLPDADVSRARSNIQARVSELRHTLEPNLKKGSDSQYIRHTGEGYAFNTDSDSWLDVVEFSRKILDAHRLADKSRWAEAVEAFDQALSLYRGEFLAEDRYEEWAAVTRLDLRSRCLDAQSRLAECYAKLDRLRQAISCCEKVLGIESHRESTIRQLMEYQAAMGERTKALITFETGAEQLKERLDVEPSSDLRELRDRIARQPAKRSSASFDTRRVAVIPFVSIGTDPTNQLLADGMTEELIYTLSNVAGLEVIAQTTALKYKDNKKSAAEIGNELQVGSVLEGSVQQAGKSARIVVQLIKVAQETHLWAEQYDRNVDDVLRVQADIARSTAEALKVRLLSKEERVITREAGLDSRARIAYMKGRLFLGRRTRQACEKAVQYFEEAISIKPNHARALTGLADAYCLMVGVLSADVGYGKAEEYVGRALAVDASCAEAHATMGLIAWNHYGDMQEAEREFTRAIDLNPNYAQAHEWYAGLLMHTGRLAEACERSEIALSLDPLSGPLVLVYAESLHQAGRLDEAVEQYQKALEINAELEGAWWGLWYSLAAAWDWDRAEAVTRETVKKHPENPFAYVNLATCVKCRGRLEEGLVEISKALALAGNPPRTSILFHVGLIHHFARQYDKAIKFFRQVLERDPSWNSAHNMIAKCCIEQECYEEALEELDASEHVFGGADPFWNAHVHMDRGIIYARSGETEKAESELAVLMSSSGRQNRRIAISGILNALGRVDEAMDWLEAAATAREPHVAALLNIPTFDQLRSHPRFQALLKRIGLVD